jgi:hypothetical protein
VLVDAAAAKEAVMHHALAEQEKCDKKAARRRNWPNLNQGDFCLAQSAIFSFIAIGATPRSSDAGPGARLLAMSDFPCRAIRTHDDLEKEAVLFHIEQSRRMDSRSLVSGRPGFVQRCMSSP